MTIGGPLTPQGSYAERGHPMTTESQEVTTVDELQLSFVGGPLTPQGSYAERGHLITTEAQEVTTVDELQLRFVGVVGGPLTLRGLR